MYIFLCCFLTLFNFLHQVQVCDFISKFHGKIQQYIQHVDMAWWQDDQFRIYQTPSLSEQYYQWLTLWKITPYNHKMKYKVNTNTQSM